MLFPISSQPSRARFAFAMVQPRAFLFLLATGGTLIQPPERGRSYLFSEVAARANGARTSVRRKAGKRRGLEISKRRSAVAVFLRDKSRAPGLPLICALNTYGRSPPAARRSVEVVWRIPESLHRINYCPIWAAYASGERRSFASAGLLSLIL